MTMTSRMVPQMFLVILWSFGATFVFKTLLYFVVILVKNIGVLMLFLELWRIGEDDNDLQDGS